MLDTLCKHHLSGAFTSGHETRVASTPPVLATPGGVERHAASARPAFSASDPDRGLVGRDALRAAGHVELGKLV